MRTGPFSDPTVVTLINRYFVPFHLDNDFWTEPRYGIEPGEESAYILMETPDLPGMEKDVVFLKQLSQVLEPRNTRTELLAFLDRHPDLRQPWGPLVELEPNSHETRIKRAELLLEEGSTKEALALLKDESLPDRAALLRAQAYRLDGELDRAAAELEKLSSRTSSSDKLAPDIELEKVRLAVEGADAARASELVDAFLKPGLRPAHAAEAYWLRGWLHHLAGQEQQAIDAWSRGIELYPPHKALHSQKAYYTMIRLNWELPANVDQVY